MEVANGHSWVVRDDVEELVAGPTCGGYWRIRGTRVTVLDLVESLERWASNASQLVDAFEVPLEAVDDALAWAAEHAGDLDQTARNEA